MMYVSVIVFIVFVELLCMMYVSVIVFIVFVYMTLFRIVRYFIVTITKNNILKILNYTNILLKCYFFLFFLLSSSYNMFPIKFI